MKNTKAVILTALALMAANLSAYASPLVVVTDSETNEINISGPSVSGQTATLMILNPGYTEADAVGGTDGAVQFFRSYKAGDGYSFDVNMKLDDNYAGELFTAMVNVGGVKESVQFSLYSIDAKLAVITALNTQQITEATVADAVEKFSLAETNLYKNGDISAIKTAIESVKASLTNGQFPSDADEAYECIREALVVAGFNASKASAVIENGKIAYADSVLKVAGTDSYTDYMNSLSGAGVTAVNDALLGGNYKTAEDIKNAFTDIVALYAITEYKSSGFGHVAGFLTKYSAIYEKYGFNLSKVAGLSNKNAFYSKLAVSNATSLAELANEFNNYTENSAPQGGGGGGGGGASGGGGGSSSGGIKDTDTPVQSKPGDTNNYVAPEKFADLGTVEWAREAIEYLYDNGVVSGKANGVFAPNDSVTRAEFVKIIVGAFKLSAEDAENKFSDVKDGEWFANAVKTASALGIVSGMNENEFMPQALVTREQAATILMNVAKFMGIDLGEEEIYQFADDGDIADYAREGVYKLKASGIISGRGENKFEPKQGMTRAESAKLIYGLVKR